jgi:tetratricopeptide (TPR) repeat protein
MTTANMLGDTGRAGAGLRLGEDVLLLARQTLGEENETTMQCKAHMARLCGEEGLQARANELIDQAIGYFNKSSRVTNEALIRLTAYCAHVLYELKRFHEAAHLQEHVLGLRLSLLAESEPDTLRAKSELAISFRALGQFEQACLLQRAVVLAWQRDFGNEYFRTLKAMQELAATLGASQGSNEAKSIAQSAVEGFRRMYGEDHCWTVEAKETLAQISQAGESNPSTTGGY